MLGVTMDNTATDVVSGKYGNNIIIVWLHVKKTQNQWLAQFDSLWVRSIGRGGGTSFLFLSFKLRLKLKVTEQLLQPLIFGLLGLQYKQAYITHLVDTIFRKPDSEHSLIEES